MTNRRSLLGGAAIGGGVLVIGGIAAREFLGGGRSSYISSGSVNPLQIPTLYPGKVEGGVRIFDLNLQRGTSRFLKGVDTPTIGINQPYLGPTLEMYAGDTVRMNVSSELSETATVHWHGFHLPARADGGPHQPIEPGGKWSPSFEVRQRASMFWYHSHALHRSGPQVYQGLAGAIYVRDTESERLDLPNDYGIDDVPLIVQDRAFNRDGSLFYSTSMRNVMMGMTGNTMLVNGTVNPVFEARSNLLRLRLLNGSNARFYRFAFDDGRSFAQVASDGGLLEQPYRTNNVILAPGERTQIVIDLSDGSPVAFLADSIETMGMMGGGGMQNRGMMSGNDRMGDGMGDRREGRGEMMDRGMRTNGEGMMNERQRFTVLNIRPTAQRRKAITMPTRLLSLPRVDPTDAVRTRRFVLNMGMGMGMNMMRGGGFTINGQSMDMQRIDETVKVNTTEIWQIENASMMAHPFHIHDVQFRVLDRNGRAPGPEERGLKDTVTVAPREVVRVILRFEEYTDPDLPYMYHCHILEHEDAGMMGQFVVV